MAEWRIREWAESALAARLAALDDLSSNFDPAAPMTPEWGWRRHQTETTIAREETGPPEPGGAFERARAAVIRFEFSDPRIVIAHFDPTAPLEGRRMLLELRPLFLRFLAGVVVSGVRAESSDTETVFGYRYDTLQGHIERGREWFLLTKSHATGEVRFEISAVWREGDFPNVWSRLGFRILGPWYQRRWLRRAHARLRHRVEAGAPAPGPARHPGSTPEARLVHEGPGDITTEER